MEENEGRGEGEVRVNLVSSATVVAPPVTIERVLGDDYHTFRVSFGERKFRVSINKDGRTSDSIGDLANLFGEYQTKCIMAKLTSMAGNISEMMRDLPKMIDDLTAARETANERVHECMQALEQFQMLLVGNTPDMDGKEAREEAYQILRDNLAPMFKEAEAEGTWFYNERFYLWFEPERLHDEMARGQYRWSAVNWKLRNPKDYASAHSIMAEECTVFFSQRQLTGERRKGILSES